MSISVRYFSRHFAILLTFYCLITVSSNSEAADQILRSVKDPNGFQVTSYFEYTSKKLKSDRGVIIMPPTGGVTPLEKSYGRRLANMGARVTVLNRWTADDQTSLDLGIHQTLFERAFVAVNSVVGTFPKGTKLTIMGASVGGMFSAAAVSLTDRFDRVMVIAGGAPFADVVVNSNQKDLKKARAERFDFFGFQDRNEYLSELQKVLITDPFLLPPKFKNKALGMIILGKDKSVPTRFQEKLHDLWLPEFVIRINMPHISGIVTARTKYFDEIVDFVYPEAGLLKD